MKLFDQVMAAANYVQSEIELVPQIGIILGTGLSAVIDSMEDVKRIPYASIPHFPVSTVQGHAGYLVSGMYHGISVLAMQGRFHYYEGYTMQEVTLPIRVFKAIGLKKLVITNVSGGLNSTFKAGDIVQVTDHINLHAANPLTGLSDERLGPRFPDMIDAYDPAMRHSCLKVASSIGMTLRQGVYVGLQGPNLETPAEYKFMKLIGGDIVGMSTVPEVIVSRQIDLAVCVLSCVSNVASDADNIEKTTIEEVIAVAEDAGKKLEKLLIALLPELTESS